MEGAEGAGEAFYLMIWLLFGGAVVAQNAGDTDWRVVLYAILSMTGVRMLRLAVSVVGLGTRRVFLDRFGPRGLARILFLVIARQENLPGSETPIAVNVATVVVASSATASAPTYWPWPSGSA